MGLQNFFHVVFIQSIFLYKYHKPVHKTALKKESGEDTKLQRNLQTKRGKIIYEKIHFFLLQVLCLHRWPYIFYRTPIDRIKDKVMDKKSVKIDLWL